MTLYLEEGDSEGTSLGNSVDDKDLKAVSETSGEKESDITDSAARENNSGSLKKVLLPVMMLAAVIVAGYVISRK